MVTYKPVGNMVILSLNQKLNRVEDGVKFKSYYNLVILLFLLPITVVFISILTESARDSQGKKQPSLFKILTLCAQCRTNLFCVKKIAQLRTKSRRQHQRSTRRLKRDNY